MLFLSPDKTYIFGLIVGGASFGTSGRSFVISLPYRQWGNPTSQPVRAGQIANDLISNLNSKFQSLYGINISYQQAGNAWKVSATGDLKKLKDDLIDCGIQITGDVRKSADLSKLLGLIKNNKKQKESFIAGLADIIGSTAKSHRKFNESKQIVSFEFSGFNYKLILQICQLLSELGCHADQLLWNHPNMHSTFDPYYNSWKKGTKLRVALDDYIGQLSFTFSSKSESAKENKALELNGDKSNFLCCDRKNLSARRSCCHTGEDDLNIPQEIRGGHYVHFFQICAALGCPNAPYKQVDDLLNKAEELICPFPLLFKGESDEVWSKIKEDEFLSKRSFTKTQYKYETLFSMHEEGEKLFLKYNETGYPFDKITDALNYLIQANEGILKGNRTVGTKDSVIEKYIKEHSEAEVILHFPDLMSVLIISDIDQKFAVMIGAINPPVYKKIITRDISNKYKLLIRPIKESDYE